MLLVIDGTVGRWDGAILVGLLLLFVGGSIRRAGRAASNQQPTDGSPSPQGVGGLPRALTEFVVGLGLLVISARWAVAGAEEIAIELGVSELVIGLTILAIGTSLPEIITTIVAAVRGSGDLALGNAVGSNIFNLLLVLGTAGLFSGGAQVSSDVASQAMPVMVVSALLLTALVAGPRSLSKRRGVVLVAAYTTYLAGLVWVS
jgi:cation:H+ antiporter